MKNDVVISIKTAAGEEPQSFICVSKFEKFANYTVEGLLGDQMILACDLVQQLAETGMEANKEGIPFFVAAVLRDLSRAVGSKNMIAGVELLSSEAGMVDIYNRAVKAAEPKTEPKEESENEIEKLFADFLAALSK